MARVQSASGFSLIEMMVALAVFALLAVAGTGIVTTGIQNTEGLKAREARLGELQVARAILKADFTQAVLREPRDPDTGSRLAAFTGGYDRDRDALVHLVRAGWANPGGREPRGSLQFVRYRLDDGTLMRAATVRVDAARDTPRIERPVLTGVRSVAMRYFDGAQWADRWPASSRAGNLLPAAVEIAMDIDGIGPVRQVFLAAGADP